MECGEDKMRKKLLALSLIILMLTGSTIYLFDVNNSTHSATSLSSSESTSLPRESIETSGPKYDIEVFNKPNYISTVSIISAGDILFHMPQVESAKEKDSYDFKPMFSEIKDIISSKDITIANFETTVNPKRPYSGYPSFNTPVQALQAVKHAGFQVLLNAHNHTLDTGLEGMRSTHKLMKENGFLIVGTGEPDEDKSVIIEKNNIKVGLLAFTYGTNYGIQYKDMINYINENKIKEDIIRIRNSCDYLIVFLHLGTEYVRTVENFQFDLVGKVASYGADAILCSHPHVARKTEFINSNGRNVLVNYSMGNFISNQNDKYTDIGSVESIVIEKRGNTTSLKSAETIPVYRLRYFSDGKTIYKIVPYNSIDKFKNLLTGDILTYVQQVSKELSFTYITNEPELEKSKAVISIIK
jgi:poly-gamma-glutamate capsule biosynthesis protein CapA/YwtB (metallophosphatase superfamily)